MHHFNSALVALSVLLTATSASTTGFTISSRNIDGTCKNTTQWAATFKSIQSLPASNITSTRLFSASDCDTLANAVPAAIASNQSLLVGLWTTNPAHFTAETAALQQAIANYSDAWMSGIAVGSEDLYRGANNVSNLVAQINSVRTLVRSLGSLKPVGHVDDYSVWTNNNTAPVILASDFIGTNIHPYFTSQSSTTANTTFWSSLSTVQSTVATLKNITLHTHHKKHHLNLSPLHASSSSTQHLTPDSLAAINALVWVTETGWPSTGPQLGGAAAGAREAGAYWSAVTCGAANLSTPLYWAADVDVGMVTSFGAFDAIGRNVFVAAC